MAGITPSISLWRYLAGLWPLFLIFGLAMLLMRLSGNTSEAGIPIWLSLLDISVYTSAFGSAAIWSFMPLSQAVRGFDVQSHAARHRLEQAMSLLPIRAIRAFPAAGVSYAVYLMTAIAVAAAVYGAEITPRMFVAIAMSILFGVVVLASVLALVLSMAYTIRLRKALAATGLFVGGLGENETLVLPRFMGTSRRPWLLFAITSFVPGAILALYIYLLLGAQGVAEQRFIMAQALVLFVGLFLAGTYLVYMLSRILRQLTSELAAGLLFLRRGQFDGRLSVLADDEMGHLARGFNTALEGLKEREDIRDSMRIAAEIQQGLLPDGSASIDGYALTGLQQSCYEVGGDFYDYIRLPDGRYWLVVADVSGKGYPAALTVANLQSMLRTLANLDIPFEEAAAYANRTLCRTLTGGRFVTMFMAKLQPESHSILWLNAGHVPPALVHGGKLSRLEAMSPPMGVVEDLVFGVQQHPLLPGDLLLACTDGVIEARDESGELLFGDKRLESWLMEHRHKPGSRLPQLLLEEVQAFSRTPQSDDITILCLKRDEI